jgi:hypothetical protein
MEIGISRQNRESIGPREFPESPGRAFASTPQIGRELIKQILDLLYESRR